MNPSPTLLNPQKKWLAINLCNAENMRENSGLNFCDRSEKYLQVEITDGGGRETDQTMIGGLEGLSLSVVDA